MLSLSLFFFVCLSSFDSNNDNKIERIDTVRATKYGIISHSSHSPHFQHNQCIDQLDNKNIFIKYGYTQQDGDNGILINPLQENGYLLSVGNWWFNPSYFESDNAKPLLIKGEIGAIIENETPFHMIITTKSYFGNEQPGQSLQIIPATNSPNSNSCAYLSTPPMDIIDNIDNIDNIDIIDIGNIYTSVANLLPLDAIGCFTSRSTNFKCTPQYPYILNTYYDKNQEYIYLGFGNNPGYDPQISSDPQYGVLLYIKQDIVGIMDMFINSNNEIQLNLWSLDIFNPTKSDKGLSASPFIKYDSSKKDIDAKYIFVKHEKAQSLLSEIERNNDNEDGTLFELIINLDLGFEESARKETMIHKYESNENKWKEIALIHKISFYIVITFIIIFICIANAMCLYCFISGSNKQPIDAKQLDEILHNLSDDD